MSTIATHRVQPERYEIARELLFLKKMHHALEMIQSLKESKYIPAVITWEYLKLGDPGAFLFETQTAIASHYKCDKHTLIRYICGVLRYVLGEQLFPVSNEEESAHPLPVRDIHLAFIFARQDKERRESWIKQYGYDIQFTSLNALLDVHPTIPARITSSACAYDPAAKKLKHILLLKRFSDHINVTAYERKNFEDCAILGKNLKHLYPGSKEKRGQVRTSAEKVRLRLNYTCKKSLPSYQV